MRNFSYTKSQKLVKNIEDVEELKKNLLITPLSLKDKLYFRYTANVNRIFYSFLLFNKEITKENVVKILSPSPSKKLGPLEHEIVRYKKALEYITHNWLVIQKPITPETIFELYTIVTGEKLKINTQELQNSLRYVQANPDNPIIQAGLSQILMLSNDFFSKETGKISNLIFQLFLYKYGYDFRGMLSIEEYFYNQKDRYNNLINQSLRNPNITPWLEFVIDAIYSQLSKLLQQISARKFNTEENVQIPIEITERQKEILSLLDQPGAKITNKILQKSFKVSPITAARDLAKLTSLGLLFAIGKGRSTFYTKV